MTVLEIQSALAARGFDPGPLDAVAGPVPLGWYDEARNLTGTREQPGSASNPRLLSWAQGLKSDAVNVARIAKTRLLRARWPRTAAVLAGAVAEAASGGPLSHDER